ncbi:FAD-dependent oxidoreductase [Bradyrhizobium sp. Ash2021]|uniref:FAD-dependent oxidoreductase n=1 Tax=Bradyrhizobium sp. Ash2021 TaxID=2954771 RepID=UPI0028156553|nr:FAD-dependent oxidoreductase [Bradyrhizobium sp. Ash2021]WMT76508.1 FAD-dependent monooxygenase [Bradyrhizobium sp. Ash2021]
MEYQFLSNEFDVLVVGAGPVGLWVACELALAKVKVAVLERRADVVTQSRALAMQGRTLEVFALRGLADRFLARGRPIPKGHYAGLSTPLDFSVFDTRFPFMLFLPQATTEALLEERALELGVDIRRGHVVETAEPSADGVVLEGRNDKASFRFSARYVVGADGARSFMRRAAGIDFGGHPAQHAFMLAEAVLDAPPPQPLLTVVNEAGVLFVVSCGNAVHHRVVVGAPVSVTEPIPLAELAAAAARIGGTDLRPRDAVWLTRFTDETRLAEHYRNGRIFLAGDAAHIHAPMGGQGLNVGIQDAMNLGWKLASVLRGTASEALLDTYERERRPVGEVLRRNTLAQVALFCKFDPSALALRGAFEDLLRVHEVNRQLAGEGSGFGVAYPEPLFRPDPGWEHRNGVSGQRLPDMDLVLEEGSRTALYRFLEAGRWVRLQRAPDRETLSNAEWITNVNLAPEGNDGLLANFASVLVRPDGYLAHVRPDDISLSRG